MRWLAIHLPALPLEVFAPAADGAPVALVEPRRGVPRIRLCNRQALAGGAAPGMGPAAARALLPHLQLVRRRPAREREALEGLANWALQFSSQVTPVPPRSLLLEASGSRRLFGGDGPLFAAVRGQLEPLGHQCTLVQAATPLGALLLAREGQDLQLTGLDGLRQALHPLPLERIPLPRQARQALHGMGLACLGELLRLPRAGLRQRLGAGPLDWLDRLLGRIPDPQPVFQPAPRFERGLDLLCESRQTQALLFAAKRLLAELGGFLQARELGAQTLHWRLGQGAAGATELRLGLLRPERRPEHFMALLRERLEGLTLEAPVRDLALRAEGLGPLPGASLDLFEGPDAQPGDRLLERLRMRLGERAVSGLQWAADHRPERASRRAPPQDPQQTPAAAPLAGPPRPLWLLPRPQRLETLRGRPCLHGPLTLGLERERIETGWWDGQEIRRDYFEARTRDGERLWIYRQVAPPRQWFLHGYFG